MIKAKDLRIGNYVNTKQGIKKITTISVDGWSMNTKSKPIPLTEEWLFKFKFEKKSWFTKGIVIECFYYQLNNFIVYLLANSFEVELINKSGNQFNLYTNWNYVHQLQNLYFALTGEDLTPQD